MRIRQDAIRAFLRNEQSRGPEAPVANIILLLSVAEIFLPAAAIVLFWKRLMYVYANRIAFAARIVFFFFFSLREN